MNKNDRKLVAELVETLEKIREQVEEKAEAEQMKFDNMPEGFQETDEGQGIEAAATALEESAQLIQDAIDGLNELI